MQGNQRTQHPPPRSLSAAGPSVHSAPRQPSPSGEWGRVRVDSHTTRLRRSRSPFLFPAEEKLVHCGKKQSASPHPPAPAGPACAARPLSGQGAGSGGGGRATAEGDVPQTASAAGEQRRTILDLIAAKVNPSSESSPSELRLAERRVRERRSPGLPIVPPLQSHLWGEGWQPFPAPPPPARLACNC